MRPARTPTRLLALCTLALALAAPAHAQPRRDRMFGDVASPQIDSQEIEKYRDLLALSDDQLETARELHAAYMAELDKLATRAREITEAARNEFRETRDFTVWRDLRGVIEKISEQRDALTQSTLDDLRLVLTPEQDAQWSNLEQFRRRRHELVEGATLSGEGVDLLAIVDLEELTEDSKAPVQILLDQYASELDRAIIERQKAVKKMRDAEAAEDAGNADLPEEQEQQLRDDIRDRAAAIRDLNRRYVRLVVAEIGSDAGARVETAYQRASFPSVYSESAADKAFSTALAMEDLSADQTAQLKAMVAGFERDRAAMNQKIAEAIEEQEMTRREPQRRGGPPRFFGGPGPEDEKVRDLLRSRRDFDQAAIARLTTVLTPEQASRLPDTPSENWRTEEF